MNGIIDFLREHQLNCMLALSCICATIALSVLLTGISTKKRKYLFLMEIGSAFLIMIDRITYILDSSPTELGFCMMKIGCCLLFFSPPFVIFAFSQYLRQIFAETEDLPNNLKRFTTINIITVFAEIMIIISQFTGFYYTFDETHTYHRGAGSLIAFGLPLLAVLILLSLNVQYYSRIPKRMRLLLLLFTINPFVSTIYQLLYYGYEAVNITIAAMAVLLYVFDLLDLRHIEKSNSKLKNELADKSERIIQMQDNQIMSMAALVESRDNSTGKHILRTSVGVRILLEEMQKDSGYVLPEGFCDNLIKAAPMHDIGKIGVNDVILQKPGRFTIDEFEIMKTHAEKGAKALHDILKDSDDIAFRKIAENVAHYHHERWDGSGYPKGLKGEEIPLEARIMAIADVYDALVSKRVYKEKMSFEEADKIIMEGMGKQFDKKLEKYYVAARQKLEDYYNTVEQQ